MMECAAFAISQLDLKLVKVLISATTFRAIAEAFDQSAVGEMLGISEA